MSLKNELLAAEDELADCFAEDEELAELLAEEDEATAFSDEELDVFAEEELEAFAEEDCAADEELSDFFDEELSLPFVLDEDLITSEGVGSFSTSCSSECTIVTPSEQAE